VVLSAEEFVGESLGRSMKVVHRISEASDGLHRRALRVYSMIKSKGLA
jgi:hypothetical protein